MIQINSINPVVTTDLARLDNFAGNADRIAVVGTLPTNIGTEVIADNFESAIQKIDKDRPVFIYCRSGGRSGQEAVLLGLFLWEGRRGEDEETGDP